MTDLPMTPEPDPPTTPYCGGYVSQPIAFVPDVQHCSAGVTLVFRGRFRCGLGRWTYLPFEVPAGVRRITAGLSHGRFALGSTLRNAVDLGIFGPAGHASADPAGFRGYSGAARTGFTISASDATPGYLPGPIDAGTWSLVLGPLVLNPLGMSWQVRIELETEPAAQATPGAGWYRGDLHLHTVHSDGERTPQELAATARMAGLDFIASTDHNTNAANQAWPACDDTTVLVIAGEEVSTRDGHWLAIGLPRHSWIDWRYTPRDGVFARLAAQVRDGGGMVIAAHPAMPLPSGWWAFGYQHLDALQIWNGPWSLEDELALRIWHRQLRRGRRLPAVAGTDSHTRDQPVGQPQTVAYATTWTAPALLAALRAGHTYLAESSTVTLDLTATTGTAPSAEQAAGPGDALCVSPGEQVTATVTATGIPESRIALITATGTVAQASIGASGTHRLQWTTTGSAARFIRAEVRHNALLPAIAPMAALTNPIWFQPASSPSASATTTSTP